MTQGPTTDLGTLRRRMVLELEARGIASRAVLDAFGRIRRELFVPPHLVAHAYDDGPLPIDHGQTISQPYVVALMVELLELESTDRVLEIGTGSGYAAAILTVLASEVYSIERFPTLATGASDVLRGLGLRHAHVRCGDGSVGWPDEAPFEAISISAGGPRIPDSLREQLTIGGRLVMPLGTDETTQDLVRLTKREGPREDELENFGPVRFVPLVGKEGWPE